MMETTRYRVLPDGNVLAHVPFRIVRKADGLRLLTDVPGANKDGYLEELPESCKYAESAG